MKKFSLFKVILLAAFLTIAGILAKAQALDSKGTDFWLTFPLNYQGTVDLSLFISSEQNTSGTVSIPGLGFSVPFTVTAGNITTVVVPQTAQQGSSNVILNNGIHVTSLTEVTIYALNRQQFTTDAYLALPTDILGMSYLNLAYTSNGLFSQFGLVAAENGTVVTITPTAATPGHPLGVPYNINLNQGQTYLLGTTSGDLSGTIIESTKPIAVFGGHQCANIPVGASACDHIVEQLPPTSAWGKNFVSIPLRTRTGGDTFRFLAAENGTTVTINGVLVATLNRGQFHERLLNTSSQIISNKPILVAQYSNGSSFDGVTSDPFMMLITPYEQFLGNYTFSTPASGFALNFVNVVAPAAAVGSLRLDGVIIPPASFTPIGSSGFSGAQLAVSLGVHRINGTNLAFGVFVYGFDSYDSYGYPGGQSLAPIATVNSLLLTPETGGGSINTSQCLEALVRDQFNNPVSGVRVDFQIKGVNAGSTGFANTNPNGIAQFCYTGANAGLDSIIASTGVLRDTSRFTWSNLPCNISLSATKNNVTCNGANNGSINLTVSGAVGTPTFLWSNNATTEDISNLAPGSYNVIVKDANNCTATLPQPIVINGSDLSCNTGGGSCPGDIVIRTNDCSGNTTISWPEPLSGFPDTIRIPSALDPDMGFLTLIGSMNGHGYYKSNRMYKWPVARNISASVGTAAANGHLVTITSAAENNFVFHDIQSPFYNAWIGLYNTGTIGSFGWVTGEPVNYTNWEPGEPNNGYAYPQVVEPYVHISNSRGNGTWNDMIEWDFPFMSEFDNPLIKYRQISGPQNGSSQPVGTYQVCYEKTNLITGVVETCCFNVTIKCNVTCPRDTVLSSPECTAIPITWRVPADSFPALIQIPAALDPAAGQLIFMGASNGHGYYRSAQRYFWPHARNIAANIGVAGTNGHLVTITSEAENNLVFNNVQLPFYYPWIGMYNTGTVGSFAWVTGEPITYTNWEPGEPNNAYARNEIKEPYVHMYNNRSNGTWNDMIPEWTNPFVAEFDNALIKYRQYAGPVRGSMQLPGVYTICYERSNALTGVKDSCCFTVTISCNTLLAELGSRSTAAALVQSDLLNKNAAKGLQVIAYPNPSRNQFSLKITSNNDQEKWSLQVMNGTGKLIETRNGLSGSQIVSVGSDFKPGMYLVQVMQGDRKVALKLIKL